MPLLVNRYVFSLVPAQAPFFLRPLLRPIFSMIDAKMIAGPLDASLKYVCRLLSRPGTSVISRPLYLGRGHPSEIDYRLVRWWLKSHHGRLYDVLRPGFSR